MGCLDVYLNQLLQLKAAVISFECFLDSDHDFIFLISKKQNNIFGIILLRKENIETPINIHCFKRGVWDCFLNRFICLLPYWCR